MARWVQVNTDLPRHRKTARLMAALGLTSWEAVGALTHFWMAVREQAPDGSLERFSPEDVHAMTGVGRGEPATFLPAMIRAGFVDDDAQGLRVHDWDDHGGKQLRDAVRMREHRAEKKRIEAERAAEFANGREPSQTVSHVQGGSGSGSGSGKAPPTASLASLKNPPGGKQTLSGSRPVFTRPELADVTAYCQERQRLGKRPVDAEAWLDHYRSNGWKVGRGNVMHDWKAAVRTWERTSFGANGNGRHRAKLDARDLAAFAAHLREKEANNASV